MSTDEQDSLPRRIATHVAMSAQAAADPLNTAPKSPTAFAHGSIPNTMLTVASIAFGLGIISALGLTAALLTWPSSWYQLSFMVAAWSTFHFLEFAVTAGWNRDKLSVDCACTLRVCPFSSCVSDSS